MSKETIKRSIEVRPSELELARIWCDMDSDQQAEFFNEITNISANWDKPFEFQLQHITDSPILQSRGREVMRGIGGYADYPVKTPTNAH